MTWASGSRSRPRRDPRQLPHRRDRDEPAGRRHRAVSADDDAPLDPHTSRRVSALTGSRRPPPTTHSSTGRRPGSRTGSPHSATTSPQKSRTSPSATRSLPTARSPPSITVLGFLIVAMSMVGLANAITMSIIERTREIGILRCVGARARDVRRIFATEGVASCSPAGSRRPARLRARPHARLARLGIAACVSRSCSRPGTSGSRSPERSSSRCSSWCCRWSRRPV